jgi:hypothetical protein
MAVPAWQAPTAGEVALAGHVNQLLAAHAVSYVWTGAVQAQQATPGSGAVRSDGLWLAQSFTAGASQAAAGYVVVTIGSAGSPDPWAVSLQADSAGQPSGTALVTTLVPVEFAQASSVAVAVMLPVTGIVPSAAYWVVAQAQGDVADYFTWSKSNQVSGASTSPDGVTWTPQSYGLLYQEYDTSAVPPLAGTWEDSGARWTALDYSGSEVVNLYEFTQGQTAAGYTASLRSLQYASGLLTGAV